MEKKLFYYLYFINKNNYNHNHNYIVNNFAYDIKAI